MDSLKNIASVKYPTRSLTAGPVLALAQHSSLRTCWHVSAKIWIAEQQGKWKQSILFSIGFLEVMYYHSGSLRTC